MAGAVLLMLLLVPPILLCPGWFPEVPKLTWLRVGQKNPLKAARMCESMD